MLAYPSYTIKRINEELTPRMVNELISAWQGDPPPFLSLYMMRQALWSLLGLEEKAPPKDQTMESVMAALRAAGATEGF